MHEETKIGTYPFKVDQQIDSEYKKKTYHYLLDVNNTRITVSSWDLLFFEF